MRKFFLMALPCLAAMPSTAQFSGYFAPHNWNITTIGEASTANVDTMQTPDSLFFTGADDGSGLPGNLTYSIVMPSAGTLSFGFDVSSNDTSAILDAYEYFVWTSNGDTLSIVTDTTKGVTNFAVDSGAVFTFSINTSLNRDGNIEAKIYDWVFTVTAPLPVDASPLEAKNTNGSVLLDWTTYSEYNCQGFDIERSIDGRNYEKIGFVATKANNGNSAERILYGFTDKIAVTGDLFYRYRQMDVDGMYTYSNVAAISFMEKGSAELSISPNPCLSGTEIQLNNRTSGIFVLTNVSGDMILREPMNDTHAKFTVGQLPAGIYFASFYEVSGNRLFSRLVVQ